MCVTVLQLSLPHLHLLWCFIQINNKQCIACYKQKELALQQQYIKLLLCHCIAKKWLTYLLYNSCYVTTKHYTALYKIFRQSSIIVFLLDNVRYFSEVLLSFFTTPFIFKYWTTGLLRVIQWNNGHFHLHQLLSLDLHQLHYVDSIVDSISLAIESSL